MFGVEMRLELRRWSGRRKDDWLRGRWSTLPLSKSYELILRTRLRPSLHLLLISAGSGNSTIRIPVVSKPYVFVLQLDQNDLVTLLVWVRNWSRPVARRIESSLALSAGAECGMAVELRSAMLGAWLADKCEVSAEGKGSRWRMEAGRQ
ncbi:hypothetical protein D9757_014220 [Collybiopsis confluens]|uniref:Uncharacterized protein n=1 Tax=Collybiopsis confluens TaxID=2823264 RepID=A0A8H5CWS7_9AGAR|nr:hypothetical protein D9757_014220 [Collybiopsis confluens]